MLIRLSAQPRPITNASRQTARMDIIEGLGRRKGPVAFCVIDIEAAVWRRPIWLDGTEVCADYFGRGEVFCDLEGPVCCSGSDVQYALWGGGWGAWC